ncbi:MAG TPA: GTPase Era [Thermoanaerobaculia bacterium]|nr:GTPase Era [Thermoanaerobaculia bacterium]
MTGEPGPFRSGMIAVVGRPNAGKSTLVNRLVGEKVAIVSDKPQTTRKRWLGVVHRPDFQAVLIDTPGIHRPEHRMNAAMVRDAVDALEGADAILWVIDAAERGGPGDARVAELIAAREVPAVVALNKVDRVAKPALLPRIAELSARGKFEAIVPISAANGDGVDALLEELRRVLPEGPPLFPREDTVPGALAEKVAEQIREPALELTRDEVPFSLAVVVDEMDRQEEKDLTVVRATLYVEREGQKGILVGKGGAMIREIGSRARTRCEERFGGRFFLDLRVRTREEWRDDEGFLSRIVNPEV